MCVPRPRSVRIICFVLKPFLKAVGGENETAVCVCTTILSVELRFSFIHGPYQRYRPIYQWFSISYLSVDAWCMHIGTMCICRIGCCTYRTVGIESWPRT